MKVENIDFILTDIEGTTTSISFVYEVLFPYFRENISKLKTMIHLDEVAEAFQQTAEVVEQEEGRVVTDHDEIIAMLLKWSLEDRKIKPLKTVQGFLWRTGYESGEILGHVYSDVPVALEKWKKEGVQMGVFSSGSIAAQKLIFGFSEQGDLTPFFSAYFDINTGGKRDAETYEIIAKNISVSNEHILFLSDIVEELVAADEAGFQTIQLVREGNTANWKSHVSDFSEIQIEK
ncbi:MAG: acireductone synthase [Crocinitomicaceae bacterium]|nr:acireductone synthase [Crocinitomicaceae bacterium]